jgi:hypothetical protein
MEQKVDAVDIFDWNHLVQIGTISEPWQVQGFADGIRLFAYLFTSTAEIEHQNQLLADWLGDATYLQSADTSEEILATVAKHMRGNSELLRRFAKQNGIRIRRG